MSKRWIIISNRLPISVLKKDGEIEFQHSAGGLATGLGSFYKSYNSLWIGWPGISVEDEQERKTITKALQREHTHPVFIEQKLFDSFYEGFCNNTIWPLFHYFTEYTEYVREEWESYKKVNEIFLEEVLKFAQPDDIIWVHDYQLILLPELIRQKLPHITIGYFLHIPFPSSEIFRLLPWRNELLKGLLGSDLIGFHTYDYVRHFLSSANQLLGIDFELNILELSDRKVKIDCFPMGIDYRKYSKSFDMPETQVEIKKYASMTRSQKVILSIDRLDYTKGIPERLEAFDLFLDENPEYLGKVRFIMVAVPSRTGVKHYQRLKERIDKLVGSINGKHGTIGWAPIWYLYRSLPFNSLTALYFIADVALITPHRDGMNLIAKEYIAAKKDRKGVLILGELAGASKELWEALIVNTNNVNEIVNAIKTALTMNDEEKIRRITVMQQLISRYDIRRWAQDFEDKLLQMKQSQKDHDIKILDESNLQNIISSYKASQKRLIFLDYDGTLVAFSDSPEKARPDKELYSLLEMLCQDTKNNVVIISGRNKNSLDEWFGKTNVDIIAEHGTWSKEANKDWTMIETSSIHWKNEIMPVLESYVDRTPGSFIEDKDFSVVWHYRKADINLAKLRCRELMDTLTYMTSNMNLHVLEGNKVIEVRDSSINKGRAGLRWLNHASWDFILAFGDDWTDEDLFKALPESAFSIKVGYISTNARFNIKAVKNVREILQSLVDLEKE